MEKTTEATDTKAEPLTTEQIEEKASELSTKFENKVTPIVITIDGEQIIGYFQEPEYDTIMFAIDEYLAGRASRGAEQAVKNCLIVEESDKRINSPLRKHSKIKASFTNASSKLITPYLDEYKKK